MSLGISGYTGTLATGINGVQILKPDATVLDNCGSGYLGRGGVCSGLANVGKVLPVTGTYSVVVDPGATNTGQVTLTLSTSITTTLSSAAPTPTRIASSRTGQVGVVSFNGTSGQVVNFGWSSATANPSKTALTVNRPDGTWSGTSVTDVGIGKPSGTFQLTLTQTGPYRIYVTPYPNQAAPTIGSVDLQWLGASSGPLSLDGAATTATFTNGAPKVYTFSATLGQQMSLGISGYSGSAGSGISNVLLLKPDGSTLASCGSGFANVPGGVCNSLAATGTAIPTTGTYSILIVPGGTNTGQVTFTLSSVLTYSLSAASLTPTTVSSSRVGQIAQVSFPATAGQTANIGWSSATANPSQTSFSFLLPSGVYAGTSVLSIGTGLPSGTVQLATSVTGTYSIRIMPWGLQSAPTIGSIGIQLLGASSGTLSLDGAATTATFTNGAPKIYTFSATLGQQMSLGLSGYSGSAGSGLSNVLLLKPDGSTLASCGSGFANVPGGVCNSLAATGTAIPTTGTYSVLLVPGGTNTGQVTFTLSSVLTYSLSAASLTPTTVSSSRIGQIAQVSFPATAGQTANIGWSSATANPSQTAFSFLLPSGAYAGTSVVNIGAGSPSGTVQLATSVTGTYSFKITPWVLQSAPTIGSVGIQLLGASSGTLSLDGAATTATFTNGAPKLYQFTVAAAGQMTLGVSGYGGNVPSGLQNITILKSDGSTYASCGSGYAGPGGGCQFAFLAAIPAGTYSVRLAPGGTNTGQVTLTLSSVIKNTLTPNAASPLVINTVRPGQEAILSFSGTAGQSATVYWSGATSTHNAMHFGILKPSGAWSGTSVTAIGVSKASGNVSLTLSETGIYTVNVHPWGLQSAATIDSIGLRVTLP